jgi:hypothetical protein
MPASLFLGHLSWCLFFFLLCRPTAAKAQADPIETMREIRRKVAAQISHLPNYLCSETVERQTFQFESVPHGRKANSCDPLIESVDKSPEAKRLTSTDRLRLDVAMSSKSEMYSWVGEGRFDDRTLSEIVKQGTTSTGAFGSFVHAIFVSDGPAFEFKGKSETDGRQVLQYDFAVPITRSGYVVSNQSVSRLTSYTGTFIADAKTLDLLRLEIRTDPLAPELEVCRSSTTLDYTNIRMNGADVLLPSEVSVRMLGADGHESYNRTVFSGCHQFMGESKLIFDEPAAESTAASVSAAKSRIISLPDGLKIYVALTQDVDPAAAAAGDPVTGKLAKVFKDPDSGLTIPKGTKVSGRIVGLLSYFGLATNLEFGLKWESIELDGVNHPLELAVTSAVSTSSKLPPSRGRWPIVRAMSRPEQRGVAFFLFTDVERNYRIPAGFEAEWVTVPAAPSTK